MSDQFFWYVTRSAAIITWLASAASILVGLMTSSRVLGRKPTIPWLVDLHRMFAAMTVTFLIIHMASLWLDSFVRFRFDDLLIPWVADVPGLSRSSIAWGVIAAWLVAAVQLTSLVKDRLAERLWRSIHLLSFGVLGLGTLHAVQAGSEADNPIVLGLGVSILTAVVLATVVRVVRYRQQRRLEVANDEPPQEEPPAELLYDPPYGSPNEPQYQFQYEPQGQQGWPEYQQAHPQWPQPQHQPQPQRQQPQPQPLPPVQAPGSRLADPHDGGGHPDQRYRPPQR